MLLDRSKMAQSSVHSRLEIGFTQQWRQWQEAQAVYSQDTLRILDHPVMEAWEHPYMQRLAEIACGQGGRVLEVGFGMGISACYIQQQAIEAHVVIEANRQVFKRLQHFAVQAPHPVSAYFGFWEDVVQALEAESFDGILFDTYPLQAQHIHCNHFPFFAAAQRLLKPGGVLTYYSDEVDDFSAAHREALHNAGFQQIAGQACPVTPPKDCLYWQNNRILAPIVTKSGT